MPETPPLFAPTAIPALSPAPTFADPANFEARADVHVAEVVAMVPLLNAENQKVFANAQAAYEGGQLANAARGLAVYKGPWSTLAGALAVPASVTHGADNELFMLLVDLADVAAHEPGVSAAWKSLKKSPALPREARTAAAPLTVADAGKWIDITANSFTQTFAACAALGAGWWCYLGNSGGGDITLDPSGAETIDGLASYVMYPGDMRLVQCDGTTLRTFVIKPFDRAWATSGNFIKPAGYTAFRVQCQAAGGGGSGGARQTSGAANYGVYGGAGERRIAVINSAAVGAVTAITVGAGGSGGAGAVTTSSYGSAGGSGGATSFGSLLTSIPGVGGASASPGGGGGSFSGANMLALALSVPGRGSDGPSSSYGASNGGSGGAANSSGSGSAGAAGISTSSNTGTPVQAGGSGGTASGGAGSPGADGSTYLFATGGGGGGGQVAASGAGGAGGNGGWPGGGGGGGGGSAHATAGPGGKGGDGGAGGCFISGVI